MSDTRIKITEIFKKKGKTQSLFHSADPSTNGYNMYTDVNNVRSIYKLNSSKQITTTLGKCYMST